MNKYRFNNNISKIKKKKKILWKNSCKMTKIPIILKNKLNCLDTIFCNSGKNFSKLIWRIGILIF